MTDSDRDRLRSAGCDPELLASCQAGEREALGRFYRLYRRDVARALARILHDSADLEDAIQDAFLEIFRSLPGFRGASRLSTWMYRIAVHVAYQRLRRRRRSPLTWRDAPAPEPVAAATPETEAGRRDAARIVYRILDRLSPKKRVVFILHEIEGFEAQEIARIVGSNPLTVRTRLHYARKEFHRLAMDDPALAGAPRPVLGGVEPGDAGPEGGTP